MKASTHASATSNGNKVQARMRRQKALATRYGCTASQARIQQLNKHAAQTHKRGSMCAMVCGTYKALQQQHAHGIPCNCSCSRLTSHAQSKQAVTVVLAYRFHRCDAESLSMPHFKRVCELARDDTCNDAHDSTQGMHRGAGNCGLLLDNTA